MIEWESLYGKILDFALETKLNRHMGDYCPTPEYNLTFEINAVTSNYFLNNCNDYYIFLQNSYEKIRIFGVYLTDFGWNSNQHQMSTQLTLKVLNDFSALTYSLEEWAARDILMI